MARIQRRDAEKYLARVPGEHVFHLHDGRILRDMHELGEALENMSDETFNYHSNENKRDFSNWVKDIIGDEKLSRDLSRATSHTRAAKFVIGREAFFRSKLT